MQGSEQQYGMVCIAQKSAIRDIIRGSTACLGESRVKILPRTLKRHPAIDQMGLTGDIAGLVGSEEHGECGDFFRSAKSAHGLAFDKGLLLLDARFSGGLRALGDATLERGRMNRAGANRIRADASADEIGGNGLGKTD